MTKWADYLISAVKYNEKNTHIVEVKQRTDLDDKVSEATKVNRANVVSNLKAGKTYMTIYQNENKEWKKGEDVRIKKVDGTEYITTDPNETKRDNLGKLPEFE